MMDGDGSNFNSIIQNIIKKSLFTERQVEIILKRRGILDCRFGITRGAYHRQVGQSREKLVGLLYSVMLFQSLGVLSPDDMGVVGTLAERIGVISGSDVVTDKGDDVIYVIDQAVRKLAGR